MFNFKVKIMEKKEFNYSEKDLSRLDYIINHLLDQCESIMSDASLSLEFRLNLVSIIHGVVNVLPLKFNLEK